MQLQKLKGFKPNSAYTTIKRDASCSRGWLRLVVQSIFFMITVASFIMILIIAINPKLMRQNPEQTCIIHYCQVKCYETPYYDDKLQNIYAAIQDASTNCEKVALILTDPYFVNGILSTMWMSDVSANIKRLHIEGGNLHYIAPGAFDTSMGKSIETLQFSNLAFSKLEENSFEGLYGLLEISFEDCDLVKVEHKVLKFVSKTLKSLSITNSGEWYPDRFTGSIQLPQLSNAFLIKNNFRNVIKRHTFSKIRNVQFLYLSYCKIEAIQLGAFDYFDKITKLDLSHNLIVTIPNGLFYRIVSMANQHTKIYFAHNLWFCDCESVEIKMLAMKGIVGDVPTCDKPTNYKDMPLVDYEQNICKDCIHELSVDMKNETFDFSLKERTHPSDVIIIKSNVTNSNLEFECKYKYTLFSNIRYYSQILEKKEMNRKGWLNPKVYINSSNMTILDMEIEISKNHGMIWYESTCPKSLYCINVAPKVVRIFDVGSESWFVFCPWHLGTGIVDFDNCTPLNFSDTTSTTYSTKSPYRIFKHAIFYSTAAFSAFLTGGCLVYYVLWKNPTLLKGSKRLLIVKHKEVNALVLPPKVPVRMTKSNIPFPSYDQNIFVLPSNGNPFERGKSVRSIGSSAPSYVSALEPSLSQLEQWRMQQNIDTESIYASINSNTSQFHTVMSKDSVTYFVLDDDVIESEKL